MNKEEKDIQDVLADLIATAEGTKKAKHIRAKARREERELVPIPSRVRQYTPPEPTGLSPHEQSFDWRVEREVVERKNDQGEALNDLSGEALKDVLFLVQLRICGFGDSVPWLTAGEVGEVFSDREAGVEHCWRHFHSGSCFEGSTIGTDEGKRARQQKREKDLNRSHDCIGKLSERLGLRLRPESGWRMLSPNAVLHWSFGPGVTVATNGQEVILMDSASEYASAWTITAKQNVIGPVTGAEVEVKDWDYFSNKPIFRFPQNSGAAGHAKVSRKKSKAKTSRPSAISLALQMLSDLENSLP